VRRPFSEGERIAFITGAFLVGVALVGFAGVWVTTHTGSGDENPDTSTAAVESPCGIEVTAPKDRALVTWRGGVVVHGTACEKDNVWLLDYDDVDRRYYMDNRQPIEVIGEKWSYRDAPIGGRHDPAGTEYTIVAVRTTKRCDRVLKAEKGDTVRLKRLPAPCPRLSSSSRAASATVVRRAHRR
jgi:hypothetical protein